MMNFTNTDFVNEKIFLLGMGDLDKMVDNSLLWDLNTEVLDQVHEQIYPFKFEIYWLFFGACYFSDYII